MENISFLIDYNIWATNRVIQQLQLLNDEEWNRDLGGSFPTPRLLCEHLLGADYRWLQRWKGVHKADIPASLLLASAGQLVQAWQPIMDEMKHQVDNVFINDLERGITFITFRGDEFTMPFWQTFYQVVNHGTYHRGQMINMLRMLDKKAVGTDIFLFFLEKGKAG